MPNNVGMPFIAKLGFTLNIPQNPMTQVFNPEVVLIT